MKLHVNTVEGKRGLIFKKTVWKMDARIELSPEEEQIVNAHPEIKKLVLTNHAIGGVECEQRVSFFLGKGINGWHFTSIAEQGEFESQLREGCADLKGHIERHTNVAGPSVQEF